MIVSSASERDKTMTKTTTPQRVNYLLTKPTEQIEFMHAAGMSDDVCRLVTKCRRTLLLLLLLESINNVNVSFYTNTRRVLILVTIKVVQVLEN